jgi:hypothetical protein
MNKDYYIIGSGDFAKEVYIWTKDALTTEENFMGFIDNNDQKKEVSIGGKFYPIIQESNFLNRISPSASIKLYFGIGNPSSICEAILTDAMFDLPSSGKKSYRLTKEFAETQFAKSKFAVLKVAS